MWAPERNAPARSMWCKDPIYCPVSLIAFLQSDAIGKTATFTHSTCLCTLTVIGDSAQRAFATTHLVHVILECVRALLSTPSSAPTYAPIPETVHVTYCDACGDRLLPITQVRRLPPKVSMAACAWALTWASSFTDDRMLRRSLCMSCSTYSMLTCR